MENLRADHNAFTIAFRIKAEDLHLDEQCAVLQLRV